MGVDRAPLGDAEALGSQRLQPDIVDAAGDRALDPGVQQLLEGGEQNALEVDGQRQQPIEEGGDRRQLVPDPVGVHEREARGLLERLERAAFDLAASEQKVELAQGVARVGAFEIVLGRKRPWPPVCRCPRVIAPSVSSRRAMVDRNRFSAFTLVAIGRKSGGWAWLVRLVRPRPWIAASAFQPGSSR